MSNRVHENHLKKDLYKLNTTASKNIKFLRLICGYSQQEMADVLMLSRTAYFKVENCAKPLDFKMLAFLSDFFKVDLAYLVSYDICDQVLNMIRGDQESVKATTFLENFFSLSRSGKEQIRDIIFEMAEYEKEFNRFPWHNEEYDELYDNDSLREGYFLSEKRFNKDIKL